MIAVLSCVISPGFCIAMDGLTLKISTSIDMSLQLIDYILFLIYF